MQPYWTVKSEQTRQLSIHPLTCAILVLL